MLNDIFAMQNYCYRQTYFVYIYSWLKSKTIKIPYFVTMQYVHIITNSMFSYIECIENIHITTLLNELEQSMTLTVQYYKLIYQNIAIFVHQYASLHFLWVFSTLGLLAFLWLLLFLWFIISFLISRIFCII